MYVYIRTYIHTYVNTNIFIFLIRLLRRILKNTCCKWKATNDLIVTKLQQRCQ